MHRRTKCAHGNFGQIQPQASSSPAPRHEFRDGQEAPAAHLSPGRWAATRSRLTCHNCVLAASPADRRAGARRTLELRLVCNEIRLTLAAALAAALLALGAFFAIRCDRAPARTKTKAQFYIGRGAARSGRGDDDSRGLNILLISAHAIRRPSWARIAPRAGEQTARPAPLQFPRCGPISARAPLAGQTRRSQCKLQGFWARKRKTRLESARMAVCVCILSSALVSHGQRRDGRSFCLGPHLAPGYNDNSLQLRVASSRDWRPLEGAAAATRELGHNKNDL